MGRRQISVRFSSVVLPDRSCQPDDLDMPLTFEATRERGIGLGSGVVVVFDSTIDMARIVERIAEFFGDESCGLCIPCRVGTVRQSEALVRLGSSNGRQGSRTRDPRSTRRRAA